MVVLKKILCKLLGEKTKDNLKKIKRKAEDVIFEVSLHEKTKKMHKKYGSVAFLVATPCHGNLGDHAIVYAEYEILKNSGFEKRIIEISNTEYLRYKDTIRKHVLPEDLIIIDGGGNLGTLWPWEDDKISEIIYTYKNNRIIVFPQTCYYEKTNEAEERLARNFNVYKSAKDLTITLRDRKSYEFCTQNFPDIKFMFIPDIVLSLNKTFDTKRENKCLLCFREDLESVLSDSEKEKICMYLREKEIECSFISTIYPKNINKKQRNYRLSEIWKQISSAKLIITDRLHAMIFATITGTPCIALDNKSRKVSGVYEWISNLDYILVCNSIDELMEKIDDFYKIESSFFDPNILYDHYEKLRNIIVK